MAVVLANQVALIQGFTFNGRRASLELHDSNRLVLATIDKSTGAHIATLIDCPLSELEVRGESSRLKFSVNGKKTLVDFSVGAGWMFLAAGVVGAAVAAAAESGGIEKWVSALRERGVQVKYRKVHIWIYLIVLGGLVVGLSIVGLILTLLRTL